MIPWWHDLTLQRGAHTTLATQLAEGLRAAILSGRLAPGERVMGTRALAQAVGVDRSTAQRAVDELVAQGWLDVVPSSGAYVTTSWPDGGLPEVTETTRAQVAGFALDAPLPSPARAITADGALPMSGGLPDVRLMPAELLARAYRRALRRHGNALLGYGDPRGLARLREGVAGWLRARRGLVIGAESLLITRGSQMGLALAALALLRPGDRVGVEALGYAPAWEAFRRAGATLVPLSLDAQGVRVEDVDRALAEGPLRALYLTPHHQYPTTVTLSAPRREALLARCAQHGVAIIEDDYDNEFHYEGAPHAPLASRDTRGVVISIGTLSKVLAPGLRVGFVVATPDVIVRLAALRECIDRQGDQVAEAAIAALLEDGELERHIRRMTRTYRSRRGALDAALREHLADTLDWEVPAGGMAIWTTRRDGQATDAWAARALALGVSVSAGSRFTLDGAPTPHLRLGFAALDEREIHLATRRLASVAR